MFIGHISCDRFRGLPFKMTSFSGPDKNRISPPGVGPAPHFFQNVPWAHFLWQASGPDLQNGLPCKTPQKSNKSPQVLDLLHTFSKMFPEHISCDRFRGLPCKMTSLSGPDKNQISSLRCWTCSTLFPKCCLGTFLVTGFGACLAK